MIYITKTNLFLIGLFLLSSTISVEASNPITFNYYKSYWGQVTVDYTISHEGKTYDLNDLNNIITTENFGSEIFLKITFRDLILGYDEDFNKIKDKEAHLFFMEIPDSPSFRSAKSNGYKIITEGTKQLNVDIASKQSKTFIEYIYKIDNSLSDDVKSLIQFKPIIKPSFSDEILFSFNISKEITIIANAVANSRNKEIAKAYEKLLDELTSTSQDIALINSFLISYPDVNKNNEKELNKLLKNLKLKHAPRLSEAELFTQIEKRIEYGDFEKAKSLINEYLDYTIQNKYSNPSNLPSIKYYQILLGNPKVQKRYAEIFFAKYPHETNYIKKIKKILKGSSPKRSSSKPSAEDNLELQNQIKINAIEDSIAIVIEENLNEQVKIIDKVKTFNYDAIDNFITVEIEGSKNKIYKLVLTNANNKNIFASSSIKANNEKIIYLDTDKNFINLESGNYKATLLKEQNKLFRKLSQVIVLDRDVMSSNYLLYLASGLSLFLMLSLYRKFIKF